MARKTGQIIRRGPQMWMVRIYVGRDPETRKRNYIGKSINCALRTAQAHLTHMLSKVRSPLKNLLLTIWSMSCFTSLLRIAKAHCAFHIGVWLDVSDKFVIGQSGS